MYKTAARVVLATLIGAFVGQRLSAGLELLFPSHYVAVLGGLAGCFIGWVGVAPLQFAANAKRAWSETMTPYKLANFSRTTVLALRAAFWIFVMVISAAASFWIAVSALVLIVGHGVNGMVVAGCVCLGVAALVVSILELAIAGVVVFEKSNAAEKRYNLRAIASAFRSASAWYVNPITASYWIVHGLYVLVLSMVTWGPAFKKLGSDLWQLMRLTIIYTHDNLRTIALVDSGLGWCVGWTLATTYGFGFGGEVIGAVAGAVWAGFNYVIVARGLLKLEPRLSTVRQ